MVLILYNQLVPSNRVKCLAQGKKEHLNSNWTGIHQEFGWANPNSHLILFEHSVPVFFGGFWRYLTRGLIWHLSQSSIRPSIWFSTIVNAQIRSWNQPVLSNKGKVSCSRKQHDWGPTIYWSIPVWLCHAFSLWLYLSK